MTFLFNVLVSSLVISFASWLSGRLPTAAGFFVALPISLLFFVPFLFSDRIGLSFWQAYGLGCAALPLGYFAHRFVTRLLT